ncbi:MAG: SOS response-associated peptidase [Myxococcota bacterium]
MCGRFAQTTPSADLVRLFQLVMGVEMTERFNIAPTQNVLVVRSHSEGNQAHWCRWGFVPSWAKSLTATSPLFNARSESVFDKPSFADSARHHRCLIPASGFYEWRDTPAGKIPVLFTPKTDPLFRFAGLWSRWADNEGNLTYTTTILTTAANETLEPFHHRMPVILTDSACKTWIDPNVTEPHTLAPLMQSAPPDAISFRPVSTRVNNVRNDDPTCWDAYK